MSRNVERNDEIVRRYQAGETLQEIGDSLIPTLTRERVRQILRSRGVYKEERPFRRSGRDELIGANLTKEDKEALRAEAKRRGVSMSSLTSDLIREMLAAIANEKAASETVVEP